MVEALNNPKQKQPKNSLREEKQERRALKQAIKDVYLRRSRGAIAREDIEHIMRPRSLSRLEIYPDLVIDESDNLHYSEDRSKYFDFLKPNLSIARNRQKIIDRMMYFRFHEGR